MSRINISKNPDVFVALCKGIWAKHTADGAASPLNSIDNIAEIGAKITQADAQNQLSAKLYRDAEQATENRDLLIGADNAVKGTLTAFARSTRDILSGIYKGNEQKLGEWTFEVDASTKGGTSGGQTPKTPKA